MTTSGPSSARPAEGAINVDSSDRADPAVIDAFAGIRGKYLSLTPSSATAPAWRRRFGSPPTAHAHAQALMTRKYRYDRISFCRVIAWRGDCAALTPGSEEAYLASCRP